MDPSIHIHQSIDQSINQSINHQSINQSINHQSINQSINQVMTGITFGDIPCLTKNEKPHNLLSDLLTLSDYNSKNCQQRMNVGHNSDSSFLSKSSKTEAKRGSNIRPDCDYKNGKQHHCFLIAGLHHPHPPLHDTSVISRIYGPPLPILPNLTYKQVPIFYNLRSP